MCCIRSQYITFEWTISWQNEDLFSTFIQTELSWECVRCKGKFISLRKLETCKWSQHRCAHLQDSTLSQCVYIITPRALALYSATAPSFCWETMAIGRISREMFSLEGPINCVRCLVSCWISIASIKSSNLQLYRFGDMLRIMYFVSRAKTISDGCKM